MSLRFDYSKADPKAVQARYGLQKYVKKSELDKGLIHLMEMRATQLNGCA
jgi:hypothetical protein